MIARDLESTLLQCAGRYPAVTVLGPRQSGKTALCRASFPDKPYASLEPLDVRAFAREDPRGFLGQYPEGAILDDVQNAPDLLGYLQERVDAHPGHGQFVLTGSQHFGLSAAVSQSLAGRTAVLTLLPPSWSELQRFPSAPSDLFQVLLAGAYPRIHDQGIPAGRWLSDYVATYVQRDVRQLVQVGDLTTFTTFLRLCAGSSGQELNLSRLGADAGVSQPTAKAWLSVLEASFVCFRLPAWHASFRKRLVKAPKLHFHDTGLLCHLLGIRDPDPLRIHPLRGAVFESWVVSELLKQRIHRGLAPQAWHFREVAGMEVDLLLQDGDVTRLVEFKSGATLEGSFVERLRSVETELRAALPAGAPTESVLVHGGDPIQARTGARVLPWARLPDLAPPEVGG